MRNGQRHLESGGMCSVAVITAPFSVQALNEGKRLTRVLGDFLCNSLEAEYGDESRQQLLQQGGTYMRCCARKAALIKIVTVSRTLPLHC